MRDRALSAKRCVSLVLFVALCASIALVATSPTAGATSEASSTAVKIKRCGSVKAGGETSPVSARKLSCKRARKIARHFLATDDAPRGWRKGNLAGCEWQLAPKGQSLYRWRVATVRMRGCNS